MLICRSNLPGRSSAYSAAESSLMLCKCSNQARRANLSRNCLKRKANKRISCIVTQDGGQQRCVCLQSPYPGYQAGWCRRARRRPALWQSRPSPPATGSACSPARHCPRRSHHALVPAQLHQSHLHKASTTPISPQRLSPYDRVATTSATRRMFGPKPLHNAAAPSRSSTPTKPAVEKAQTLANERRARHCTYR